MASWTGWLAAIGGLLAVVDQYIASASPYLLWIGGLAAIVFGIWGALSK